MTYSVWYTSSPALGSIQECEGTFEEAEEAFKWFQHHTTNVTANMGWTHRVIITDSDDYIIAEWKFGEGVVWPKEEDLKTDSEGNLKYDGDV
jgi:hypothetical protein